MQSESAFEQLVHLQAAGDPLDARLFEQALRESDVAWEAVLEAAGVAIIYGDVQGNVLAVHPSFTALFGYSEAEFKEIGVQGITHPDDFATDLALFQELIEGRRDRYDLEKRYLKKDGSLMWGRLAVMLLRDEGDTPRFAIAMVTDISEIKQATELTRLREEAEERRRRALALNDTLVQGMATALMALQLDDRTKAEETLRQTLAEAKRLVTELLEGTGGTKPLQPGDLVRGDEPSRDE